jgi:hypothetical protein
MKRLTTLALVAVLALVVPVTASAQGAYKIKTLVKVGDMAGDTLISKNRAFWPVGLSDRGHLLFDPWVATGSDSASEYLFQLHDGTFTTIVRPGGPSPDGRWPDNVTLYATAMSLRGTALFGAIDTSTSSGRWLGVYRYDPDTASVSLVVKSGMPTADGFTATGPAGGIAINNLGDMALTCQVKGSDGVTRRGLFFVSHDGRWQTVVVGEQEIPGWGALRDQVRGCSLNDAGVVAFTGRRMADKKQSAFLWEAGKISTLMAAGTDVPGVGKITAVSGVRPNNQNRDVLFAAELDDQFNRQGIYRLSDGKLTPLVAPGQELPGGAFRTLRYIGNFDGTGPSTNGLGSTNLKGQTAFLATLQDGTAALYRLEADGQVTLVMKEGQVLDQGTVTRLGQEPELAGFASPPEINSSGDILVAMRLNSGPNALAVLTPSSP